MFSPTCTTQGSPQAFFIGLQQCVMQVFSLMRIPMTLPLQESSIGIQVFQEVSPNHMFSRVLWKCIAGEFSVIRHKIKCNFFWALLVGNLLSLCCMFFFQFLRRCGYSLRSARQTLELWQGTMKEIGGKFGTSVLTYFVFLKWLLMFNIFSFLVNFGFITIPLLVYEHSANSSQHVSEIPPNVSFRGLELLTGAVSGTCIFLRQPSFSHNLKLLHLLSFN